jgi:hypothetical protein
LAETDLEWDERQLCSDDACIGVIGPGNQCNVCGRPAPEGTPYRERAVNVTGEAYEAPDGDGDGDGAQGSEGAASAAAAAAADFDDERELCADDACIGLIGADGLCKVCGKPRSGDVAATSST